MSSWTSVRTKWKEQKKLRGGFKELSLTEKKKEASSPAKALSTHRGKRWISETTTSGLLLMKEHAREETICWSWRGEKKRILEEWDRVEGQFMPNPERTEEVALGEKKKKSDPGRKIKTTSLQA